MEVPSTAEDIYLSSVNQTLLESCCQQLHRKCVFDMEITAAISLANAKKFIDKLPQGFDTTARQNGTQLSGGKIKELQLQEQ
ncbi:hypothetical protein KIW84_042054 [Lathyrus oleraceus]|uniref:Uncharacterized protein n=1 Tax=Pisum sativum TaxID=3888 RepID=A0A9D4XAA3_PEA|nr:hypothetical protein KIW84_042054 [Pisum sativum]